MKMRNAEIEGFVEFILGEELVGKKSRMRTRFVKLASERLQQIEEERMDLIKQYAELDEDGNPKTHTDAQGNEVAIIKDANAFNKEYMELLTEEYIIDETEERKEMLLTVQEIVLNTERAFKGQDALVYDRYCEIVEGISY